MATSPVFASAFKVARVRNNAAANTASDGSGTVAIFQDDTGSADYSAPAAGATSASTTSKIKYAVD